MRRRTALAVWPALLLAPLLALAQQSLAYALVTPSCARQSTLALHAVSVISLLLLLMLTALAARAWWRARHADVADAAAARLRLLAPIAAASGALSLGVAAAMWWPVWLLPPCLS